MIRLMKQNETPNYGVFSAKDICCVFCGKQASEGCDILLVQGNIGVQSVCEECLGLIGDILEKQREGASAGPNESAATDEKIRVGDLVVDKTRSRSSVYAVRGGFSFLGEEFLSLEQLTGPRLRVGGYISRPAENFAKVRRD